MVSWSSIVRPVAQFAKYRTVLQTPVVRNVIQKQLRQMSGGGHNQMIVQPSRFQWNKFKDLLHFYVMLGLLPVGAIIFISNIFIGPAELQEIPEGYEPKYWEYHRHPITRFIARYIHTNPQQEYEKMLHFLYEENEKSKIRNLDEKINTIMSERKDYQAYYFRPATAKYHRISKEIADELAEIRGDI